MRARPPLRATNERKPSVGHQIALDLPAGVRHGPLDQDSEGEQLYELDGIQKRNIALRLGSAWMKAGNQHPDRDGDHQGDLPDTEIDLPKASDRPGKKSP